MDRGIYFRQNKLLKREKIKGGFKMEKFYLFEGENLGRFYVQADNQDDAADLAESLDDDVELIRIDDEAGILLNDYSVYSDDDYFL
jgi:hypothetical protein